MTVSDLVNFSALLDDSKCFEAVRQYRWPDGVRCTSCGRTKIIRNGHADAQPHRQRYRCKSCGIRFDDLTGTMLAGHHQPLRVGAVSLPDGIEHFHLQIADELSLSGVDAQAMTEHLRHGLAGPIPATKLKGKVEIDEVYIVAGHKAQPAAVATKRRPGRCRRLRGGARWRRTSRQSSV